MSDDDDHYHDDDSTKNGPFEGDDRSELSLEISEDHFSISDNESEDSELILTSKAQLETAIAKHIRLLRIQSDDEQLKRKLVIKICELRIKLNQMNETHDELYVNGHHLVKCDNYKIGSSLICDYCLKKQKSALLSSKRNGNAFLLCQFCGFRVHQKCQSNISRKCPKLLFEDNESQNSNESGIILNICPEIGLASQKFQCAECKCLIFIDNCRICDYNGHYYCNKCHWGESDSVIIPARVIHNWDFSPRPVSRHSMQIIHYIMNKPILFNITELNSMLYGLVDELAHLKRIRGELSQMLKYIRVCKQPNRPKLKLHNYLVRDDTLSSYSLIDLSNLSVLLKTLTDVHETLMNHITKECEGCRGKGFFCELCRDKDDVLFPFLANCANCAVCSAVYHKNCYHRKSKKCPRCERIKEKQQIHNHFDNDNCDSENTN